MILLSFDIEEFDTPLEYKYDIPFDEQLEKSCIGTNAILEILSFHNINATFFVTANFAIHEKALVQKIKNNGNEIGSHGYFHSSFEKEHLASSKIILEEISGSTIYGFRMPRMFPVNNEDLQQAGYIYNSSLHPTFIPGRYNNFNKPRTYFYDKIFQLPASVTPLLRIPLFWLMFHNSPLSVYLKLCKWVLKNDGYLNIYFHPWEFVDLHSKYNLPKYITRNSGELMIAKMDKFIKELKPLFSFETIHDFMQKKNLFGKDF